MTINNQIEKDGLVVALIPAHNEVVHIDGIVRSARKYLPVWVVDDGSTDDTAEQAKNVGAIIFQQKPNQGKGAALRFGFHQALRAGCQGVITLDGDGQHDPDEIPSFIAEFQKSSVDLIIGFRQFGKMPVLRRIGNSIGRILFSLVLGHSIQDNQSGYRYISRRLMEASLKSDQPGFEFEVEMIAVCTRQGYILKEIPIKTIYYEDGKSHIKPWQHSIGFIKMLWQTARFNQAE